MLLLLDCSNTGWLGASGHMQTDLWAPLSLHYATCQAPDCWENLFFELSVSLDGVNINDIDSRRRGRRNSGSVCQLLPWCGQTIVSASSTLIVVFPYLCHLPFSSSLSHWPPAGVSMSFLNINPTFLKQLAYIKKRRTDQKDGVITPKSKWDNQQMQCDP